MSYLFFGASVTDNTDGHLQTHQSTGTPLPPPLLPPRGRRRSGGKFTQFPWWKSLVYGAGGGSLLLCIIYYTRYIVWNQSHPALLLDTENISSNKSNITNSKHHYVSSMGTMIHTLYTMIAYDIIHVIDDHVSSVSFLWTPLELFGVGGGRGSGGKSAATTNTNTNNYDVFQRFRGWWR